jgi:hypothetical protein
MTLAHVLATLFFALVGLFAIGVIGMTFWRGGQ